MWLILRHCTGRLWLARCHYSTKPPSAEEKFRRKVIQLEKEKDRRAPEWEKREQALRRRYGQWNPTHKLSRQQMNDIRELKQRAPHITTAKIADFFNVNPESIRRILKSKWVPNEETLRRLEKRSETRKKLSIEKHRAENLEAQASAPKDPAAGSGGRTRGSPRPVKAGPPKKHSKKKDTDTRKKMPYTEGIGDFIE